MDDSDSGFGGGYSGGGLSYGGGYSSGLGDTGLGSGASGSGSGLGLGAPSGGYFGGGGSYSGGSGGGLSASSGDLFSYNPSFSGGYSPSTSYSLGDVYSQDSGQGMTFDGSYGLQMPGNPYSDTGVGLGGQERDRDWWNSEMGKFVKSIGKFALSTNPVGRAGLTAYGLYNAAQNKDYGALAQGLVGTATGNGLLGSVAGIGTNMAMGKDVRGQVGSTLGGLVGGGIAGPVGGMVGSQMGRSVATSDRAPVGGGYADRSMSGGGSGGRNGLDAGQLMAGLGNLYLNNKAARGAEGNVQSLSSMFGPKSAYAQQLRQQLERRDAAEGRRSQYGPREVELQAKLAQMAAQYGPNISQSNMNAQQVANQRRQQNLSSLYAMARESGLMDQFSSGLNNLFSSNSSPSLYFDSNTSSDVYSV